MTARQNLILIIGLVLTIVFVVRYWKTTFAPIILGADSNLSSAEGAGGGFSVNSQSPVTGSGGGGGGGGAS